MSDLAPCRDCRRHIRVGGPCPFCGCAVHESVGLDLPHRMSRGAAFAFMALAVAGGAAVAGCQEPPQATPEPAKKIDEAKTTKTAEPMASVSPPPAVAAYGAPAPMPSLSASTSTSVAPSTSVSTPPRPAPTPTATAIPTPAKPAYGGPPKPFVAPPSKPLYGGPPGV